MEKARSKSILLYGIIASYFLVMAYPLLFKYVSPMDIFNPAREYSRSVNWRPFQQIEYYLSILNTSPGIALFNLLGNIALFIPLGVYLPLLKKDKRIIRNFLIIVAVSLLVEVVQFTLGIGAGDIDDIFLNGLGGLVGLIIYKCLAVCCGGERKLRSVILYISILAAVGLPVLVIVVQQIMYTKRI